MKGIDISHHNGNIDFDKVKNSEIETVIMRCGYGREISQKDEKFEEYYANAKGKFNLATYLYSYADSIEGAKLEVQNTLKLIEGKSFDYVFYDLEDKIAESLSKDTITNMYFAYKEIIEQSGYNCGIYCNKNWATNKINVNEINDLKWVGSYGNNEKQSLGTIAIIQDTLNKRYNLNIAVDNIFGRATKDALVTALQTELNKQFNKKLTVDGIFGKRTAEACVNVKKGANGDITWILQAMLIIKGYNILLDGIFGTGTEQAVRRFQKTSGILQDGIAGKNTFKCLFS